MYLTDGSLCQGESKQQRLKLLRSVMPVESLASVALVIYHVGSCYLFVLNPIVGQSDLVHVNPLSPSGPTSKNSSPSLVSNNLRGATGSSGSLC